jgi:hypothetical protein
MSSSSLPLTDLFNAPHFIILSFKSFCYYFMNKYLYMKKKVHVAKTGEWNSGVFIFIVGGIRCVKNLTLHSASVLSISAGDHWLGIGAADNSMSLFHRPQERFGSFSNTGSKAP